MDPKASLSQQLLEQNEDLIAATVENLQLGRLDDCMQLYSILQKNLLVLSEELDNYPIDDSSNSSEMIRKFPDQIVRRDVLEEYMLQGAKESSTMPIPAACQACAEQGTSAETCRISLRHIEPSTKLSDSERVEFLRAAEVLAVRHRQYADGAERRTTKRQYKRWSPYEKYSLMIAIAVHGSKDTAVLANILGDRSENQVRSFIAHNFRSKDEIASLDALLMNPPWGYQPPEKLAHYFKKSTSSNSIDAEAADSSPRLCEVIERDKVGFCSEEDIGDARELIEASRLDPKRLKRDFLSLLTVAGEIKEKDKASEDDISMSYSPLPQIPRLPSLKQSCESSSSQRLPSLPEAAPENFIDALRSQGYISGTKDFAMYGNPYTGNPFYQNYLMGTGYGHYFPHGPTTMPILPNTDSRSVPDISRGARVNYPSFPTLGVPTHPFFIDPDKYQSSNSVDSTGYKSQLGSGSQALNSVPSLAGVDTSSHSDQARRAKSAEASTSTSALDQSQHSKSRKTMRVIQSRNDCNSEVVVDRIERDDSDSDVMEYGLRNSEAREKSKKIKKYHN